VIPVHECDSEPNHAFFVNWNTCQRTTEPIQFAARLTAGLRCRRYPRRCVSRTGRAIPSATRRSRPSGMGIVGLYQLQDNYFQQYLTNSRTEPPAASNPTAEEPISPIMLLRNSFRPLRRPRRILGSAEGLAPALNLPETVGSSSFMAGSGGRNNRRPRSLDGPNVRCRNTIRLEAEICRPYQFEPIKK
jgi:hypothetical protein